MIVFKKRFPIVTKKKKKMQPSNYGELFKAGVIHHPENSRSVFFLKLKSLM